MTPEEIKQLATDTFKEQVFFSTMIPKQDEHLLASIFMTMTFMDHKQIEQLSKDKISAFYEYLSEAGPRAINGYPIFMSMKAISVDDLKEVQIIVKKLQNAADKL